MLLIASFSLSSKQFALTTLTPAGLRTTRWSVNHLALRHSVQGHSGWASAVGKLQVGSSRSCAWSKQWSLQLFINFWNHPFILSYSLSNSAVSSIFCEASCVRLRNRPTMCSQEQSVGSWSSCRCKVTTCNNPSWWWRCGRCVLQPL